MNPVTDRKSASAPTKAPRLRLPLASMLDVQRELARLYRECKSGQRDVSEGSKLANMLHILARLIEGSNLEARIEALESTRENEGVEKWPSH